MSPHEGTKHKHKVNNISLTQGALFVLPRTYSGVKMFQCLNSECATAESKGFWQGLQNLVKYFTLISQRITATWILQPQYHLKFMLPTTSTGRGSKQIELLRSNSSRLAKYLAINIKSILGNWAEETPSPTSHISPHGCSSHYQWLQRYSLLNWGTKEWEDAL